MSVAALLEINPLASRRDMETALLTICDAARPRLSAGRARLHLGEPSAEFSRSCQEMEGVCRLLWGLAPMLAQRPDSPWSSAIVGALTSGTDPTNPEYWGRPTDYDQRLVECAAIAYALLIAPDAILKPMTSAERRNLAVFLASINTAAVRDNNWLLFRVLVNAVLPLLGAPLQPARINAAWARMDTFYRGRGWYSDGPSGHCDYYGPFAIHFYALLYAVFAADVDPVHAVRCKERAVEFAHQFIHWFADDGSAIPFGRSLTYRCAQTAFWGALAFAAPDAFPCGVAKGLVLRNLRWWFRRPIFSDAGLLSVGYGYASPAVAENYTSAASPYWALKAFLPLALPDSSRFWRATEDALPALPHAVCQPEPRIIICRDRGHVFALAAGVSPASQHRNAGEKYAKFCYSNQFAFSIPSGQRSLASGAHDSMLALSEDGEHFRVRTRSTRTDVQPSAIVAEWWPWPDVRVITWLIPAVPWHVRVHLVHACRPFSAWENGFAIALGPEEATCESASPSPVARARTINGVSVVKDLSGQRQAVVIHADTNTNILHRRTVIPSVRSTHVAGDHWLAAAVLASDDVSYVDSLIGTAPAFTRRRNGFEISTASGQIVFGHAGAGADATQPGVTGHVAH